MDYFDMERGRYNNSGGGTLGIGDRISPVIRTLIIVNLCVFLIQSVLMLVFNISLSRFFGFVPYDFLHSFRIWQIVTYMFLHGGIFHIFWNLLGLWMFGADVERELGSRNFLKYYLGCGIFAGLCTLIFGINSTIPVIGASGAIFGIVTAFGMLFPEQVVTLLLFFVIPVKAKAKYLALGFAILTFFQCLLQSSGGGIAYFAHMGGIVFGFFYFKNLLHIRTFLEHFPDNMARFFTRTERKDRIPRDVYISEEIDPILEKISREGINSLTKREKKLLKKAKEKLS